jgi:hypothetical protein
MKSRYGALLLCFVLSGCCIPGGGCNVSAGGGPVAWDGLGVPPTEDAGNAPPASDPAKPDKVRQIATQVRKKAQAVDKFEQQQTAERSADAKVSDQLKICRNC